MRRIQILDTTLRDGEQAPGFTMNLQEKRDVAKQLERLGADIIEAGFPIVSPEDFDAVATIAKEVTKSKVAALSRARKCDIDSAAAALGGIEHGVLNLFIATSDIHMESKLFMTREQLLQTVREMVRYARPMFPTLEFSAEDATRSDRAFLAQVLSVAVEEGADIVNIADTVGYTTGKEMYDLCRYLHEHVPGLENRILSIHCHNDLGQAVANSLAAIRGGAGQVECTINGIGERAGNASLEEIVMSLKTRWDFYQCDTRINTKQIYRSSRLLRTVTGIAIPPNKAIVGKNAFLHEAGIHQHGVLNNPLTYEIMTPESVGIKRNAMFLGKHSGRHAFEERLLELGYHLDENRLNEAFAQFKALADRKAHITDRDLDAILGAGKVEIPEILSLESFVVNSGSKIAATAVVNISRHGETLQGVAAGSGPIDAAFTAISNVVGLEGYALENYSIQSVTEGEDALGEVSVRLQKGNQTVTGRGLSTDIIEASIKAYLNAINKVLAG